MARKSRKQPSKTVADDIRSAVGYIRLSVANKDESCSVENQKLIIEQWAMQHELFISNFYIDANYSGSNFERPAFKQMLTDIGSGQINCIVVKDLSRIGREFLSTSYYIEEYLPSKKVRFVSVNDHFKLEVDLEAAETVKLIFSMAVKNTPINAIVRYLNENSIPTPIQYARAKGLQGNYDDGKGTWNTRSVKYILTNRQIYDIMTQKRHVIIEEGYQWHRKQFRETRHLPGKLNPGVMNWG